ncbi:hypothetical protein [Paenibacillus taiwanensis]|uniref:hypothetical protein n=1 Tax=Paenibacillus taiwanensis TaxID=401638 RepID=UPI00048D47A4|nr:hypothetical protein [Paenibacillus taiwanensis]
MRGFKNKTVPLYVICASVLVVLLMYNFYAQTSTVRNVMDYDRNCLEDTLKLVEINAHTLAFCHKRQSTNIYGFALYKHTILSSFIIPTPTNQKMTWHISRNRMYSVITGEIQDETISKVTIDAINQDNITILNMDDGRKIYLTVTDLIHSPVIRGLDHQENIVYSSINDASP